MIICKTTKKGKTKIPTPCKVKIILIIKTTKEKKQKNARKKLWGYKSKWPIYEIQHLKILPFPWRLWSLEHRMEITKK